MNKMRKFALVLVALILSQLQIGCAQQKTTKATGKPDTLYMPLDTLNSQLSQIGKDVLASQHQKISQEALATLLKSYALLDLIVKDSIEQAIELNKEIVGELEILLEANPNLSLIPIEVRAATREIITDIPTAKQIVKEAKAEFKQKHYQNARYLLEQLSSEMIVVTTYLPLETYPVGMRKVGALLLNNQKEEAVILLSSMLNTMVIKEIRLPLPVLRATIFIRYANALLKADPKQNKAAILNLLANADYQLHLAEAMGYGEVKRDYKPLYAQIKALKAKVEKEEEAGSLMDKLLKDVEKLQKGFEKERNTNKENK